MPTPKPPHLQGNPYHWRVVLLRPPLPTAERAIIGAARAVEVAYQRALLQGWRRKFFEGVVSREDCRRLFDEALAKLESRRQLRHARVFLGGHAFAVHVARPSAGLGAHRDAD